MIGFPGVDRALPAVAANGTTGAGVRYRRYAYTPAGGVPAYVYVPIPRVSGSPVVQFFHGRSGTESQIADADKADTLAALLDAGYIVASSRALPDSWGNADEVDYHLNLLADVRSKWEGGAAALLAQSMGGLAALNIAGRGLAVVSGVALVSGVCSLRAVYDADLNGQHAAAIRTAYDIAADGADYATRTADHDPLLYTPSAWGGLRLRFFCGSTDTDIPPADHGEALASVASAATEAEVVAYSGGHSDAARYDAADLADFFGRCFAS